MPTAADLTPEEQTHVQAAQDLFSLAEKMEARVLEKFDGDQDQADVARKLRPRNAKQERAWKQAREPELHKAAAEVTDPWGVDFVADFHNIGLEERDQFGRTPLHMAAWFNNTPAVIRALLDLGANLEAKDPAGNTPLHMAAWFNDTPSVIKALLEAGADRDARDRFGRTPWDYAEDRIALAEASEDASLAQGLRQAFELN
ncbi:MAG: ankyrin repeat domain-containing protein [Acidobacteriota bacterium]|nr:ankyrin repeat domain-containing protein [Acidobacteriota bacterium]